MDMLDRTEPATLVIADIAGYSGYLAGVELDHAQDVLADLIDTVVDALRPTLILAKLEGDAAFTFLPGETVDGPGLRDVIEGCYFAFQRRVRDIGQASACECNACIRIPRLDLKFVAHRGTIARQRMAGMEELVGNDVVLVHRLLKNHVTDELGLPAYALYTEALAAAMGLDDPGSAGMRQHRESFETVGEVVVWVSDLSAAWEAEQDRGRRKVTDASALGIIPMPTADVPREIMWEWATSPIRRLRWTTGLTVVEEETVDGHRGVGTVNHCMHGDTPFTEEVLDWVPPEYMTKRISPPGMRPFVATMELIDRGLGQTDMVWRMEPPESADDRPVFEMWLERFTGDVQRDNAILIEMADADARERAAGRSAEPAVPTGAGRFLTEPVRADSV